MTAVGRRKRSVARLLADALATAGVERAFTVPGESFLGLLDALPAAGIDVVATRHEGGAAFMAEATAQLTGRPAACLGTRAVGAANLAIGIHTARQNSTPVAVLIGQVKRDFRGREAFQEVDQVRSFGRLAKWAAEVDDPAKAAQLVTDGLRAMARGRPGPVLFSLPEDVLDEPAAGGSVESGRGAGPDAGASEVSSILRLLREAERPLILAGAGVLRSGRSDRLVELAERLAVPVMASWRRPDVFPNDHPLYLGMTGYGAARTVLPRFLGADALLVLGSRLSEPTTFDYRVPAGSTRWAHVDLEPRTGAAGLRAPDVALRADAGAFLASALAVLASSGHGDDARRAANAADRRAYVDASRVDDGVAWEGRGVHPGRVVTSLQRLLPADAVITTDAGNFGLWLARGYRFAGPGTFLGPTSGAMGYGLPAAIAASLARPGSPAVAVCGDGGFAMTMNELETAARTGARPIAVVFDNRRYGTIAAHQVRGGRRELATDLGPIDFAAVARAFGAYGRHVAHDAEFEPALREAMAADRPAVLHLDLDRAWVSPDQPPEIGRSIASAP